MRVGIDLVSEKGTPGGIHTYTNRLLEAVVEGEEAADVELVIFANDDYRWLFPVESARGVRILHTGRSGLGASRRRLLQQLVVPRMAREARVDLIHSVNNVLPLTADHPAVVTVHDLSPFELPERFGMLKRSFLRWAVPRSVRRAARVIADARSVREEILRWIPGARPESIAIVPLAAGGEFHPRQDGAAEAALRKRYGLPEEFLLTVGAAEPGKNHRGIARALEILRTRKGISPAWAIAGAAGPDGERLAAELRATSIGPQAILLGMVDADDLPHLYRMARVFLFPSLYEGFGLPLLEALACGTPAITSDVSALPEVAGRAALRVPPRDPEGLARAIARLWNRPRLRSMLSRRGPEQARRFSWKETAARTLDVYRDAYRNVYRAAFASR